MKRRIFINYGPQTVTRLILYGTFSASIVLVLLLLVYDEGTLRAIRIRTIVGMGVVIYLVIGLILERKKQFNIVNWMLIILYIMLAFSTLTYWGLNAAVGIFATSFVIMLSGILFGARSILPVTLSVIILLCVVQTIHSLGIIKPNISVLSEGSSFLDVLSYVTIFSIFALVAWISGSQMEKTLSRAKEAEEIVRNQRNNLAVELEKESARLRQIQLKEIQQLYKFATLGQSTAATLHELSNYLSILNLDMDDLKLQNKNSKAIENAKEGIEQINLMVRQVRRKLNSYDTKKIFNSVTIIRRVIKDEKHTFKKKHVDLEYRHEGSITLNIQGDPLALMQVITILLHNALDACYELPNPKVSVRTITNSKGISIEVSDNGIGISSSIKTHLFEPKLSTKPSGLGVGLYIAKHLIEAQFKGSIKLKNTPDNKKLGAEFILFIPQQNN